MISFCSVLGQNTAAAQANVTKLIKLIPIVNYYFYFIHILYNLQKPYSYLYYLYIRENNAQALNFYIADVIFMWLVPCCHLSSAFRNKDCFNIIKLTNFSFIFLVILGFFSFLYKHEAVYIV